MAIRCMNPNNIGSEAENLFNLTAQEGGNLIESFRGTIESLKSHWRGSDAEFNLNNLAMVYSAVVTFVKDLQKVIVAANNNEIIPLQKHICLSGGSCTVGKELSVTIQADPIIDVPTGIIESWTDPAILADATTFADFPTKFKSFIGNLKDSKEKLFGNWLDGANRAEIEKVFASFLEMQDTYVENLKKVRDNLNVVAELKKPLL